MAELVPGAAIAAASLALMLAGGFARQVRLTSPENDRVSEVGVAIRRGAMTFLQREYSWLAGFVAVMAVFVGFTLPWGDLGAPAYLFGALLSGGAGYVGMRSATSANTSTADAARRGGVHLALPLAFRGGAVMGLTVAGLGLLGIGLAYLVFAVLLDRPDWPQLLAAIVLGGSSVALFARVGGGIYTKAADVGADLVGKMELGMAENDPRNPAVIADHVGDNVGDVAGMGADLFESYLGALVAPMLVGAIVFEGRGFQSQSIIFPLAVATAGVLASSISSFLVRARGDNLGNALKWATLPAIGLTTAAALPLSWWLFGGATNVRQSLGVFVSVASGLAVGLLVGLISERFTSDRYRPVKEVARHAQTGPATVLISGLAEGMRSASVSMVAVTGGLVGAFLAGEWALGNGGGLYGVALAAVGLLATVGATIAVDAYGPIADNADGIAEMARFPPEARETTDALHALGNSTAPIAKGLAIGSAAVTTFALIAAFAQSVRLEAIDLTHPATAVGLLLGAIFPFFFTALTLSSVGRATNRMIDEVRRQFQEIAGLREGNPEAEADYEACVDIAAQAALREMVIPGLLTLAAPLAVGFASVEALGGFLAGALVTGFLLAIFMANAGGAWDSSKKLIEAGAFGGTGSDAHKASVIGDSVGDPFKDTSSPAINTMLKMMSIVALIFSTAFVS